MARLKKRQVRRWLTAMVAVALWIALAAGWSWFLITRAFERDMDARLVSRAHQLSDLARQGLAQNPDASATQAAGALNLENEPQMQAALDEARLLDRDLAYVIIWTPDGALVSYTPRDLRLPHSLSADHWFPLDPQQHSRISNFLIPELSKDAGPSPTPVAVTEATVPVMYRGQAVGYLSIAYTDDWLGGEFYRTQRGLLYASGGALLAGVVLILIAIHLGMESMEKRRRAIQQSALARTSMLTERGMLASVLAHEVRSPLTALRFNLHSLRTLVSNRSADVDRQVELTDRCEREIRRLDGMLNDFLQRTQVIGPVESASVNTVVKEAIEFLRPALERKNVKISIHLDDNNPLVHVHPDELRQVILNLAANGQDAMPKGGTLAVSTVAESAQVAAVVLSGPVSVEAAMPESAVTILIRDSGTGIPPELHERIFEPFFSTKPNGSGLGLALVRRVISGAGGTVFCESMVGEGTTFRIVLPRAQGAEGAAAGGVQAGQGYAHVHREEHALELDSTPELVIDRAKERAGKNDEIRMTNDESNSNDE